MDSLERMNEVIDYVEENIAGDIDFTRISRIACCPTHQFVRIFAFITDMSLAEYIRRRRLSLAALDLQQGRDSVIGIAMKYGYESHASFSRAFREHHGIAPTAARDRGAVLNILPRMSFHPPLRVDPKLNYRIEKGEMKVARVSKIAFEPFGPYRIVGKAIRTRPMSQNIAAFWGQCFTDGTYDKLVQLKDYIPLDGGGDEYVGHIRDYDSASNSYTYLVGMFMKPEAPVPEGYAFFDLPECTMAKAWIEGEEYEIYANAYVLAAEAMGKSGYAEDGNNLYQCEVYTDERFGIPKSKGEKILTLDYFMPCKKL